MRICLHYPDQFINDVLLQPLPLYSQDQGSFPFLRGLGEGWFFIINRFCDLLPSISLSLFVRCPRFGNVFQTDPLERIRRPGEGRLEEEMSVGMCSLLSCSLVLLSFQSSFSWGGGRFLGRFFRALIWGGDCWGPLWEKTFEVYVDGDIWALPHDD